MLSCCENKAWQIVGGEGNKLFFVASELGHLKEMHDVFALTSFVQGYKYEYCFFSIFVSQNA